MASLLSFDVNAQVKEKMIIESTHSARSTLLRLKTSTTVATSYTSAFQSFPSKERKNVFSKLQTLKPKEFAQEPLSTLGSSLRASPNTPVVTPMLTTDDSEFTVASSDTEQKTVSNVTETFGMFSLVSKAYILKAVTGSLKSATGKEDTTTGRAVKTRSFKPTATKEGLLQTTSAVHEAKQWCGPCEHRVTRKRAYCSSDMVVHVQVISEEIDDPSLDRKYRVKVIRPFKISSDVSEVRTVWIRNDSCQCHLLIPEKRYLLMGQLTMHEGSTKTINGIELGRDSYVEEWRESMIRRILEIKKRGCLRIPTSQTPKVAITPPSEGKCPPCRISKKRNRNYCQSDFVIKARVIASSFDSISRERTYVVKIITVYRSLVKIRKRQEIHVQNDDCHCPYLLRGQLYVIMGTAERISRTEVRLMIPPRPFVRLWDSNMRTKYRSLSGICDK
ncbi:uncharacterized protein [Montipora foliosa]|uniref:uncharacterized protein n=1 Tax=Montipora foliosa TaxID=591990 RepID=UPI0035F20572